MRSFVFFRGHGPHQSNGGQHDAEPHPPERENAAVLRPGGGPRPGVGREQDQGNLPVNHITP